MDLASWSSTSWETIIVGDELDTNLDTGIASIAPIPLDTFIMIGTSLDGVMWCGQGNDVISSKYLLNSRYIYLVTASSWCHAEMVLQSHNTIHCRFIYYIDGSICLCSIYTCPLSLCVRAHITRCYTTINPNIFTAK